MTTVENRSALTTSTSSSGSVGNPYGKRTALDETREFIGRFIRTVEPADLDLFTLWAAHTHLVNETHTTPRLLVDSPVPGSGKTTALEHLNKLCVKPVQLASISSPALLSRLLEKEMRTILIDEADRALDPKKEGVGDMLGILNSGYKRGGTRPVLVPAKGGSWDVAEMSTFAPVAMAGNAPDLPDDTKSRCIRVLLLPDFDGTAEESDWELIEDDANALGAGLASWANTVREAVRVTRPVLPDEVKGRGRERWSPLLRVAEAAGGRWPAVVRDLAVRDMERIVNEREEGLAVQKPHVVLLNHIHDVWNDGEAFIATDDLIARLIARYPQSWGTASNYGKDLTSQRMGRMLVNSYNIHSYREPDGDRRRGYQLSALKPAFAGFGLASPTRPDESDEQDKPVQGLQPHVTHG
ncbi:DUF3631 domain-containing protein [Mycolicibacterium wolinskyi]|uniref:DUF3631 domain-containing protein n=1 Tax=Mycolicibacterium wolinskyi TaxID=59750 RepID=UPI003917A5BB